MHARADGGAGLGYTYASPAAADVIAHTITPIILSRDAMDIEAAYVAMRRAVRNAGVRALRPLPFLPSISHCGISRHICSECRSGSSATGSPEVFGL